jgi:hypothetical protein
MDDLLKLADDEHLKVLENRVEFLEDMVIYQMELIAELMGVSSCELNPPRK